ncbi:uncharacterized protein [Miscanthus floridulus]|uniref:uncharacterized protein n=1 Tax=Miscanthus floridulus TaxID=154761 RepID=UPI0034589154
MDNIGDAGYEENLFFNLGTGDDSSSEDGDDSRLDGTDTSSPSKGNHSGGGEANYGKEAGNVGYDKEMFGSTANVGDRYGGYDKVGIVTKDIYNYCSKNKRSRIAEGDARTILVLMLKRKNSDPDFYFDYKVDDDNLPHQTDGTFCGLFVLKYMELWDGTRLVRDFTQDDVHIFRMSMIADIIFSPTNDIEESK